MIIVMTITAGEPEILQTVAGIEAAGLKAVVMPGGERVAVGITSAIPPDLREPLANHLGSLPGVDHVTHVTRSYKLASREFHAAPTCLDMQGVRIGGPQFQVIAGPCSVESYEQMSHAARAAKAAGARILRGGAFKPRTSPYAFQGLQGEGLRIIQAVGRENGLLTITEVMQTERMEKIARYVDILQIGARNMQNYPLLIEAGRSGHPVFLKRGPSATIEEFLLAAEYILYHNNPNVVLCERGIHPMDRSYCRNTLDLSAVPVLKEASHLPVFVDPSHGTGVARYVPAMSLAAAAAGADGLMIEMHPTPRTALSDGPQSLTPEQFDALMQRLRPMLTLLGKEL